MASSISYSLLKALNLSQAEINYTNCSCTWSIKLIRQQTNDYHVSDSDIVSNSSRKVWVCPFCLSLWIVLSPTLQASFLWWIHKEFKPCTSVPSVFLRVSLSLLLLTKNLQQLLEGLLLNESLESPIFKMFLHGSPSASQERLTNVLSSLQIQFWQEATRVSFIKALHITLYAHSYCRHFWAAINLCDRNHSSFLQMTSSNCWVLFSIALHLSWSYPVMQTPTRNISSSCPGELMWQQWKAVEN